MLRFLRKVLIKLFVNRIFLGIVIGIAVVYGALEAIEYTSTDSYCESCHVHPQAVHSWKLSTHYSNQRGVVVHCVECHLPPSGFSGFKEKLRLGLKDIYGKLFKDASSFDWEERSRLEHAATYTFKESCVRCHQNLFTIGMSEEGDDAHLHYSRAPEKLRCINCHLHVGHFEENVAAAESFGSTASAEGELYTEPAHVEGFVNFTETIPGSPVSFDMVAVPGGTYSMGSPVSEAYRDPDEGPVRAVEVSSFWMGRAEVTWDEYEAFYAATASEGRTDTRAAEADIDAISGATPPWGTPDQGWGKGKMPAITMTFHAAQTYCRWLSSVTGKKYRLPTEAEWEYACRGGRSTPYFFEGDPGDFTEKSLWNRIFGADEEQISSYSIYAKNSGNRSHPPSAVEPNPFGLLNMSGNVWEFCSDWYSPDTLAQYPADSRIKDPAGPLEGKERVTRGGSFKSDAADLRCAARDHTRHSEWLMTDPQIPKSIWWYSDSYDVGFRVVCEYNGENGE